MSRALASLAIALVLLCAREAQSIDAPRPGTGGVPPASAPGNPEQPSAPDFRNLRGEWLRAGPGFACRVATAKPIPREAVDPDALARACLHMGPFVIGGDVGTVRSALGAPHRTLPQDRGAKALIYFLVRAGQFPYLIVTIADDRIAALQVTGPTAAKDYSFNHIDLGVTTATLVERLGPPKRMQPSSEKDTELWSYSPWPFSFEVKDDRITSIRIADPKRF